MGIFQKSVLNAYFKMREQNSEYIKRIEDAWKEFLQYYGDIQRIENIRQLKEENYQEGFLREIFVDVLGYILNPNIGYNMTTEYKNGSSRSRVGEFA